MLAYLLSGLEEELELEEEEPACRPFPRHVSRPKMTMTPAPQALMSFGGRPPPPALFAATPIFLLFNFRVYSIATDSTLPESE